MDRSTGLSWRALHRYRGVEQLSHDPAIDSNPAQNVNVDQRGPPLNRVAGIGESHSEFISGHEIQDNKIVMHHDRSRLISAIDRPTLPAGLAVCRRRGSPGVAQASSVAGSLTLVVTPSGRQSGESLRKAEAFVRRLGIKVRRDGDNEISIGFPNGSRIVGLPGNEATTRGYSAFLLLIDETARVEDRLYRAMLPSMAVANGDLWLMSTPYGKRGFFWEEWEHGGSEWERISVPATECPRISPLLLAEECAKGDETYRREYLCEFGVMEGAVFSLESIDAALQDFEALSL